MITTGLHGPGTPLTAAASSPAPAAPLTPAQALAQTQAIADQYSGGAITLDSQLAANSEAAINAGIAAGDIQTTAGLVPPGDNLGGTAVGGVVKDVLGTAGHIVVNAVGGTKTIAGVTGQSQAQIDTEVNDSGGANINLGSLIPTPTSGPATGTPAPAPAGAALPGIGGFSIGQIAIGVIVLVLLVVVAVEV